MVRESFRGENGKAERLSGSVTKVTELMGGRAKKASCLRHLCSSQSRAYEHDPLTERGQEIIPSKSVLASNLRGLREPGRWLGVLVQARNLEAGCQREALL